MFKSAMPFLNEETKDEVYRLLLEKEKYNELQSIAYALSEEQVQELFEILVAKGERPHKLFPFIGEEFLREIVLKEIEKM